MLPLTSFSVEFFLDFLAPVVALPEVAVATILASFELAFVLVDDVATLQADTMPTDQPINREHGAWVLFSMSLRDKCSERHGAGDDEGEKKG
jgi:hypothetical protein